MYKPSIYNFIWPLDNRDGVLIYNSFTTSYQATEKSRVTLLEAEIINEEDIDIQDKKTFYEFVKNGFLVEEVIDELKVLKFSSNKFKHTKDVLSLTIAPTLACNFNCEYCYQEAGKTSIMQDNIQAGILNYIEKSILKLDKLYITWYGGEPLLAKKIVLKLSDQIESLTKNSNCELAFFMITNGYLLDSEVISELKRLRFKGIQITLDGPPEIHNKRRSLKNGEGSFDHIISNIKQLIKTDIKVYIRVNVDKTNEDNVEELFDLLKREGVMEALIYPAQVTAYTEACKSSADNCLDLGEYSDIDYKVQSMLIEKGFHTDFSALLPKRKTNYCCADQVNSFLIDPQGSMYKCWNHIGTQESVGNVADNKSTKEQKMRHINWIEYSPFDYEECIQCKLLPLCMGGCPYQGIVLTDGKPNCIRTEYSLRKIMTAQYECVQAGQAKQANQANRGV